MSPHLADLDRDGLKSVSAVSMKILVFQKIKAGLLKVRERTGVDQAINSYTLRESAGPHPVFYTI